MRIPICLTLAGLFVGGAARAQEQTPEVPLLTGSSTILADAPAAPPGLLVFKGTLLLNEFVYRTILKLPADAAATPQMVKLITAQLAAFLGEAGYDLAKVRAQIKDGQIEVQVDEGALDRVIVVGTGWITALRFRAALNLPLDVFNRRLFELQMPKLARQFGLRGYRYELWPVHLLDTEPAMQLDDVEELRAMPLIHPARGYELRIFAVTVPWSAGFSPEVLLNGQIGYGVGGRYRWKDLLQEGDRWQTHFRLGGAFRSTLDESSSTFLVNSNDLLTARWLSKPWGGSNSGLRMTVAPRAELWDLQRRDLSIQNYRIGTLELGTGAGAQLTHDFALYFTFGLQRRFIFDLEPAKGKLLVPEVTRVPLASNRGFLRLSSAYTFNPTELRQDLRNGLTLELNLFRPTVKGDSGFLLFDLQGRRLIPYGWHELRVSARVTAEAGDVAYVDEIGLGDHLRIGFGLVKYTRRVASLSLELRYSLLRDKLKVGVFNDLGVWRHLGREDAQQSAELSGSSGAGIFFFLFDELQVDAFYGIGWSTDGSVHPGLALEIKEAF